jgi:flagellar biosynthesis protein FlhG
VIEVRDVKGNDRKAETVALANGPVTVSVTSGKGGVGKTSLTVNLAYALVERGKRVLVVDGDLGLANVDVLLKLTVTKTIRDLLETGADPSEALVYPHPDLGVLPASSGVPDMVALGPEEQALLGEFLHPIMRQFDFVLMDTAAGIGSSVLWFNTFVRHNVVLATSDPTSITDAYAVMKVLSTDYGRNRFLLVLNQVRSEQEGRHTYEALEKVAKRFLPLSLDYLGAIPEDPAVRMGVRHQTPFFKRSPQARATAAVGRLALRIEGLAN